MARAQHAPTAGWLIPLACFFASGFASLLYEICWIRKAALVLGATGYAVSAVVAVFFGGLALGSYLFGRYTPRVNRPLRLYAWLELVIGLLALATPAAMGLMDRVFAAAYPRLEHEFALLSLTRFALIALLLLPPTILMGGTLPLFCRQFIRRPHHVASNVALLYGMNTLGAAAGCAVTGFVLIRYVGVNATLVLGAAINGLVALLAWVHSAAPVEIPPADEQPAPRGKRSALAPAPQEAGGMVRPVVYALFFLAGLVALGNEILWTRFLSLLVRNTVYTYTLSLTIVLLGIVLGSLLAGAVFDRIRRLALAFGLLQVFAGLISLAVLLLPPGWWRGALDPTSAIASLWAYLIVLLPPSILSGAVFPLAVRMVVADPTLAGLRVGSLTALNTLGGIIGSLGVGFLLLPHFGMQASLLSLTACSLLIGIAAFAWLERTTAWPIRAGLAIAAVTGWMVLPRVFDTRLPQDYLADRAALVDFREGIGSHLAVVRGRETLRLEIDLLWQGQDRKSHQVMAAHIPMLLTPHARSVAVVGLGTGQTCSRFLMYDIARLDCVEIESRLVDVVRRHFDSAWMSDPRLRFVIEDGRNFLAHTHRAVYDVIAVEVGQIFRPGLASFYTVEFYRAAGERLKPGGVLCQFVPLAAFDPQEFRTIVRTFIDAFPNSTLWYNTSELLLIGRNGPWAVSPNILKPLAENEAVRADTRFAHWGGPQYTLDRPEVLLGGFLCGPAGLERIAGAAPIYRDDRPFLEYTTSRYLERGEVAIMDLVREHLEPLSALVSPAPPDELARAAYGVREINLRDVAAMAYQRTALELPDARNGERVSLLQAALDCNPYNVQLNRLLGDALLADALQTGRPPIDAVMTYQAAVALDPNNAKARHHLGRCLYVLQQHAEAAMHLQAALKLDPADADAHNNLGAALATQGDLAGAVRHFSEAVRLQPSRPEFVNNLARARSALSGSAP